MDSSGDTVGDDSAGANGTDADAREQMRRAIRAAAQGSGSPSELRCAAQDLVGQLRREKAEPEEMLIRIKEILAEAGIEPAYTTESGATELANTPESVYRNVIVWSIRYYYDEPVPDRAAD